MEYYFADLHRAVALTAAERWHSFGLGSWRMAAGQPVDPAECHPLVSSENSIVTFLVRSKDKCSTGKQVPEKLTHHDPLFITTAVIVGRYLSLAKTAPWASIIGTKSPDEHLWGLSKSLPSSLVMR